MSATRRAGLLRGAAVAAIPSALVWGAVAWVVWRLLP